MPTTLRFSLKCAEIPVLLEGPDGVERQYVLREMDGRTRDSYLNALTARINRTSNGQPGTLKNFDGYQANLVARCLIDEAGAAVSEKDIQQFPSSVQAALFQECQRLCGLNEEAEEESKND